MNNNLKWAVIFAVVSAVCLTVWFFRGSMSESGTTAVVRQGDKVVKEVSLSEIDEPYEFEVRAADGGYNVIRVEKGRIAVVASDCPDKICVRQGYIDNGASAIVCLPHRLSVTITGDGDIDAVAGGN